MGDKKPLTKSDLVEALKGVETKIGGLDTRLGGVETKLRGLNITVRAMSAKVTNTEKNMVTQTEFVERADGIEAKIGETERSLKLRISKVQIDLAGRIANVSITSPTMKMFNELRDKVNRHHPTN